MRRRFPLALRAAIADLTPEIWKKNMGTTPQNENTYSAQAFGPCFLQFLEFSETSFFSVIAVGTFMAPKFKDGDVVVAISGKWVSWAHTFVAYSGFLGALITGLYLHYHKIVENEYYVRPRMGSKRLHY